MPDNSRPVRAFTLVELLVVAAIISLLVSIILPAITAARRYSQQSACLANLGQMSLGFQSYTLDASGVYPAADDPLDTGYFLWMGRGFRELIKPYIDAHIDADNPSVLWCPGSPDRFGQTYERTSYAYSLSMYHSVEQVNSYTSVADTYSLMLPAVGVHSSDVRWPAQKIIAGEWESNHKPIPQDNGWWVWAGRRNFLFADGHAVAVDADDIRVANDGFPDPLITVDGYHGIDVP